MTIFTLKGLSEKGIKLNVIFACKHPHHYIFWPIALVLLLTPSILLLKRERDPVKLFAPSRGPSVEGSENFARMFPNSSTIGRQTGENRYARIIISLLNKRCRNSLVDSPEALKEVLELDRYVRYNLSIQSGNMTLRYDDLCVAHGRSCFRNPAIEMIKNGNYHVKFPFELDLLRGPIFYAVSLGKVTLDESNMVTGVEAFMLHYLLRSDTPEFLQLSLEWEKRFISEVLSLPFSYIDVQGMASHSFMSEIDRNILEVMILFSISSLLMVVFIIVACYQADCVTSKVTVAFEALISSLMANSAALCIYILCDNPYVNMNVAVPFIILGVGLDDTFVILSVWERTSGTTVEERMVRTFDHCGISITITSLTNIASFTVGIFNPFSSISYFCKLTAISMVILYLLQMTFLLGCLVMAARREMNGLNNIYGLPVYKIGGEEKGKNFLRNLLCTTFKEEGKMNTNISLLTKIFSDFLAGTLSTSMGRMIIALSYCGYLGMSIYGITQVNTETKLDRFLHADSYWADFFRAQKRYFNKYSYRIQVALKDDIDYSEPEVQSEISNLVNILESHPTILPNHTEFWLSSYKQFLSSPELKFLFSGDKLNKKERFYTLLSRVFLRFPSTRAFSHDIIFNENKTKILHSRFYLLSGELKSDEEENALITHLIEIKKSSRLNIDYFNYYFPYLENNRQMVKVGLTSILCAATAVFIIFFLFIQDILVISWVGLSLISIETGVIGFFFYTGISFANVAILSLIICIAFSVDSCVHITYTFQHLKKLTLDANIRETFYMVGPAIVKTSLASIISPSILYFYNSYVIYTFYKIIFLVMVLSMYHSLIILPAGLASFAYKPNWNVGNKNEIDLSPLPKNCSLNSVKKIDDPFKERSNIASISNDAFSRNPKCKDNFAFENDNDK